jgi:hypothetical protein
MPSEAFLEADLVVIHFTGTDAFGRKFEVALEPEDAKSLLFKLHRTILKQEEMRQSVNQAHDGGKAA